MLSLLPRHHPDIAENDWVVVVLEVNGTFGVFEWSFEGGGGREVFGQLQILMHQHSIELHGDAWPGGLFAGGIEFGGFKIDVIGLPRERRETHVKSWFGDRVDATRLVVFSLETK